MNSAELQAFRDLCTRNDLAMTHQRQVIYEVLRSMSGHPSPEDVYLRVRKKIPAISLATVYKNINIFLASEMFREVSLHHGSLRVEINPEPHHHLVCRQCRRIEDISEEALGALPMPRQLGHGFEVERYTVDVLGLCADCQKKHPQPARN